MHFRTGSKADREASVMGQAGRVVLDGAVTCAGKAGVLEVEMRRPAVEDICIS